MKTSKHNHSHAGQGSSKITKSLVEPALPLTKHKRTSKEVIEAIYGKEQMTDAKQDEKKLIINGKECYEVLIDGSLKISPDDYMEDLETSKQEGIKIGKKQAEKELMPCYKCHRETGMKFCIDCLAKDKSAKQQERKRILKIIEKVYSENSSWNMGEMISKKELKQKIQDKEEKA